MNSQKSERIVVIGDYVARMGKTEGAARVYNRNWSHTIPRGDLDLTLATYEMLASDLGLESKERRHYEGAAGAVRVLISLMGGDRPAAPQIGR